MAEAYPWLEELSLKRMVVTDEVLELISCLFKNFSVLVLSSCKGFAIDGLIAIATNCKFFFVHFTTQFYCFVLGSSFKEVVVDSC
ncbi:TPA_asm: hypothetical protein HUJ06_032054 [Nelumbo nucifera]|uniref:Uncharacterized protein n=1 Tax=Nelumbo nucifera TaxID=4432 RepID=A0A822ZX43_NELNU|nr:TPA_asm: hypothetical protein HUJ06_032054 [Nelumbo nucifera]